MDRSGAQIARRSKSRRSRSREPGPGAGPLAIVGLSAHFGPFDGKQRFEERVLGYRREIARGSAAKLVGNRRVDIGFESQRLGQPASSRAFTSTRSSSHVDQFRIPPRELGEMLPQQSLMLRVAAEAIGDARWDARQALRTGVLVGIGLDLNTTNFHLRWSLADQVPEWNERSGSSLPAR